MRTPAGAQRVGPGPRDEERAGSDCSRVRDGAPGCSAAQGWCSGSTSLLHPRLSDPGSAPSRRILIQDPWLACLLASLRSPGAAPGSLRPARTRDGPGRQGGNPRRAADRGAHFPTPRLRSRSVPQRALRRASTFHRPGTPGDRCGDRGT